MRTTFDLPKELLEEARKAGRFSTRRETVMAGLKELLRRTRRDDLRRLAGRIEMKVGLRKSRQRSA